tara:strand:+ start:6981 stop:7193 length:213 start_codon:yes stop_codon:yes gene_type:complete
MNIIDNPNEEIVDTTYSIVYNPTTKEVIVYNDLIDADIETYTVTSPLRLVTGTKEEIDNYIEQEELNYER